MTAVHRFGHIELNAATRQILIDHEAVSMGARAFDVLLALIERRDRVVTKNELLDLVWPGLVVEENNLQVQVSALRKLLGPQAIATIPGRGYRFALPVLPTDPATAGAIARRDDAEPSIAVLPFANLSDDIANEYFADGLAEELLSILSQIPGLRVVSRTSAFYFKGKNMELATIAQKLNVATILEGSVRKAGNRARISVQLIDAQTDAHRWSGVYERELDDIFATQDEIARSVVAALRLPFLVPTLERRAEAQIDAEVEAATKGGTSNGAALQLFLEGQFHARQQTRQGVAKALKNYEQALALDPKFARAWVSLASAHAALAGYGGYEPVADGFRLARAAVQRALALQPDLAAAHAILSWIQLYCDWDWTGAYASARRALLLGPNSSSVLMGVSIVLGNLGYGEEAEALVRRALILDPLDGALYRQIADAELDAANLDVAEAAAKRALELSPQLALAYFFLGMIHLEQGQVERALEMFQRESLEDYRLLGEALARNAQGGHAEATETLSALVAKFGTDSPCQVAQAYACCHEPDLAFEWLERAYASRDPRLVEARSDSLLRNLHADPRWHPFLEKMGLGH